MAAFLSISPPVDTNTIVLEDPRSEISVLCSKSPSFLAMVIPTRDKHYLFGYPVLHSASPAFHNLIFQSMNTNKTYECWSTSRITQEMMDVIRSPDFGGSSVTMPMKVTVMKYLDEITPEAKAVGAVNTIVPVLDLSSGIMKAVGTNTDYLGVRNSLLRQLGLQVNRTFSSSNTFSPGQAAALSIGGGGAARSAIYAMHTMGLAPIYLMNRDQSEIDALFECFPGLPLVHLKTIAQTEKELAESNRPPIVAIVGAIPAYLPVTDAERGVYNMITHVLTQPYTPPTASDASNLPLPHQRLFLDMAYRPRNTPLLQIAAALNWEPIGGIQAMIEQGLAQSRMWQSGDASVDVACGDRIGDDVMNKARDFVEQMADVVVVGKEYDRAQDSPDAPFRV
ncbi:Pentafunctional AROM polypeptide [Rhizoctonia solani]|uniref:Pentafunctional AROM polypeptide n=1 Tax=Rhizoctonia solani TaxID=456999 RepID=A0A8H7LKR4_9AGAM|nr:Pentafunctional AROM polypeptide [Rhizoctonia solani]